MKWEDVSKRLPGRSALSCRLHYQNFLERKPDWDEEKKNKLSRLYERFKKEMWDPVAKELQMPWRAVEAMHWQLGSEGIAQRAGVPVFSMASSSSVPLQVPMAATMGPSVAPSSAPQPPYTNPSPRSVPATMHPHHTQQPNFNTSPSASVVQPYYSTNTNRQEWYYQPQQQTPSVPLAAQDVERPARQRRSASSTSQRKLQPSPARRRAGSASGADAPRRLDDPIPPLPHLQDHHFSPSERLPPVRFLTHSSSSPAQASENRQEWSSPSESQRQQPRSPNFSYLHPHKRPRLSPQQSLGSAVGSGGDRDNGELGYYQTRSHDNRG